MRFAVVVAAACLGSVSALSRAVEMKQKDSAFVEETDFKEIAENAAARLRERLAQLGYNDDHSFAESAPTTANGSTCQPSSWSSPYIAPNAKNNCIKGCTRAPYTTCKEKTTGSNKWVCCKP